MEKQPVIDIQDMSFSYNGELVLESVNLAVKKGDFASVVGTNGGGKTTLLKLILGLLEPRAGRIEVFGFSPERARTRIGYLPQHIEFDTQFPISVLHVILAGRLHKHRWFGRYTKQDREIALEALSEVGLGNLAGRPFADLSGGQRQRVLIARALAAKPDLLVLDEPTASLDPQAEQDFYRLLNKVNERLTILMVSHDLNFVSSFVDTVVCVNRKVVVHPTIDLPQEFAGDVLSPDMRMILHDRLTDCGTKP